MELNCSHKGSFEKNILSVTVSTACAKSSSVIFTKLEGEIFTDMLEAPSA